MTKWSDQETATLRLMYHQGKSVADIGAALSRSSESVGGRIRRLRMGWSRKVPEKLSHKCITTLRHSTWVAVGDFAQEHGLKVREVIRGAVEEWLRGQV